MKIAAIDRTFLAKDVYKRWKNLIRQAETDITIFTPYFDKTLLALLQANTTIARGQITIITDISPENAFEMPYQLRAAKRALSGGISVRSLDGLHAKVLLIDQKQACIGSQNFTTRGRRNKEATVLPATLFNDSIFLRTLQEWCSVSREIKEDEIDEFISALTPLFRQHKKLHDKMEGRFVEVRARQEERKNVLLLKHLEELEQKSKIRLAQKHIYARLRVKRDYETLEVMNPKRDDLIDWEIQLPNRSFKRYDFEWLEMHPIILADSNRMGFARLGKRGITYIREGVKWPAYPGWIVGDMRAAVVMTFPKTDTEQRNLMVELKTNDYHGSCVFEVTLNGKTTVVKNQHFTKGKFATQSAFDKFYANVKTTLLESEHGLSGFFSHFLQGFKYSVLGVDNKNAASFFERCWYKVSVVQIYSKPVLVFAKYQ